MSRLPSRLTSLKAPTLKKAGAATRFAAAVSDTVEIHFGGVVVKASLPAKKVELRNVAEGRSALVRAKATLSRPGVEVRAVSGVPLYHADPDSPGLLVRTLNGRTTRGRFVGGKFKPA